MVTPPTVTVGVSVGKTVDAVPAAALLFNAIGAVPVGTATVGAVGVVVEVPLPLPPAAVAAVPPPPPQPVSAAANRLAAIQLDQRYRVRRFVSEQSEIFTAVPLPESIKKHVNFVGLGLAETKPSFFRPDDMQNTPAAQDRFDPGQSLRRGCICSANCLGSKFYSEACLRCFLYICTRYLLSEGKTTRSSLRTRAIFLYWYSFPLCCRGTL